MILLVLLVYAVLILSMKEDVDVEEYCVVEKEGDVCVEE
jgi:hypothetical protein